MTADELKAELAQLERKRAQLASALSQLEGAIGFCKGLIQKAEPQKDARAGVSASGEVRDAA